MSLQSANNEYPLPVQRILPNFPSFTERYFEPKFHVCSEENSSGDQCILFHSNRICVVTLAPSHPVISQRKKVSKIDFQVNTKTNRLDNKVSGKWKKGGQRLYENSTLCVVYCDDGSYYSVEACIKAVLIEINEKLLTQPTLVSEQSWSDGFIAIVLPNINYIQFHKDSLLSSEAYNTILKKREQGAINELQRNSTEHTKR